MLVDSKRFVYETHFCKFFRLHIKFYVIFIKKISRLFILFQVCGFFLKIFQAIKPT